MNLYAKITTDTGKVIGKGANKSIKIEVLDSKQNVIFEKVITAEHKHNWCKIDKDNYWCDSCHATKDSDGGIIE